MRTCTRAQPRWSNVYWRRGSPTQQRIGTAGTDSDFAPAIYFADDSDPLYRIEGGSDDARYGIDGGRVRLPDGAAPSSGADAHLAVVYKGEHWGCYRTTVDHEERVIRCEAGRRVPIDGDGLHAADTAARFPSLAGRIRFQELDAGRIRHALFAASSQIASDHVFPAEKSDGEKDASLGYPPMGTRFQLDPNYMTDERLKQGFTTLEARRPARGARLRLLPRETRPLPPGRWSRSNPGPATRALAGRIRGSSTASGTTSRSCSTVEAASAYMPSSRTRASTGRVYAPSTPA